jgi:DNA polymerase
MTGSDRKTLAAVLEWSIAMGADTAIGDVATDWLNDDRAGPGADFRMSEAASTGPFIPSRPAVPPARSPLAGPRAALAPPPAARALEAAGTGAVARSAARSARDLNELRRLLEAFDGCPLKATAKNLCFYRGAAQAPVMIIGEAPGRDEDIEGRPFVGRAGQLLDRMLAAAGWSEETVHITNIVYWRPPGNRTPTPQETEACRPFLERQIELVAPRVLLLLGGSAAKQILRTDEGILKIRGKWRTLEFGTSKVAVLASLHPAYLLRTPIAKRQVWRDLLSVRAQFSG